MPTAQGPLKEEIAARGMVFNRVSASVEHSAWIENGRVRLLGSDAIDAGELEAWPNVSMVRLGNAHIIGLAGDGSLVFAGANGSGQCALETGGIPAASVEACAYASIAVLQDGTVRMAGSALFEQRDLEGETNVVQAAASDTHIVLLHADGTLTAHGDKSEGACDVADLRDIVMVDCGYGFTIALDRSGRVYVRGSDAYGQKRLDGQTGICAVAAGNNSCFALRPDGTLMAAGSDSRGQLSVENWQDVAAVACGYRHTIGMNVYGQILGAGTNDKGQLGADPA